MYYTHIYIHICIHTCMHVYIHIYTQTHTYNVHVWTQHRTHELHTTFNLRLAPAARCPPPATAEALLCSACRFMGLGLSLGFIWESAVLWSSHHCKVTTYHSGCASKQPLSLVVDRIRKHFYSPGWVYAEHATFSIQYSVFSNMWPR